MSFGAADSVDQSGMNGVLAGRLEDFRAAGLERRLHVADGPQGTQVVRDGRELVNFSSNDYLGLAAHPALIEAALIESRRSGFGSGASRLVSGTMRAHAELEVAIAENMDAIAAKKQRIQDLREMLVNGIFPRLVSAKSDRELMAVEVTYAPGGQANKNSAIEGHETADMSSTSCDEKEQGLLL
jgi:hypothetical protein